MFKCASMANRSITTTYTSDYGRPSSTKLGINPLLVKYPVGKSKPVPYSLPPNDHVYGCPVDRKADETTAKVLSSWQTKQISKNAEPSLDYVTMNKICLQQGITNARGQFEHRKAHPVRVKVIDRSKPGRQSMRKLPSDSNPNFAYGLPTRPSSPVSKLMSDHYEREYNAMLASQEAHDNTKETRSRTGGTRSLKDQLTPLQYHKPKHLNIYERDVSTYFKMPRFLNIPARVDCYQRYPHKQDCEIEAI